VHPTFSASNSLRDLLEQLDGLPLCIELAAARTAILSPAEISARLTDRFRLLRPIGPGPTLEQSIAASWALLTPSQQRLLAQLAAFEESFTLSAAEALAAEEDRWLGDELQALIQTNLLRSVINDVTGEMRFSFLNSIRDFVRQRQPASDELFARLDEHLLQHTDTLTLAYTEDGDFDAIEQLALERSNLRAAFVRAQSRTSADALRAGLALAVLAPLQGDHARAVQQLHPGLAQRSEAPASQQHHWQWRGRLAAARLMINSGQLDATERELQMIPVDAPPNVRAMTEVIYSRLRTVRGDLGAASSSMREVIEALRRQGAFVWATRLNVLLSVIDLLMARRGTPGDSVARIQEIIASLQGAVHTITHPRIKRIAQSHLANALHMNYHTDLAQAALRALLA